MSLAGTWMQSVAQAWLVWRLTRSTEMLGLVHFLGQVPVFLFGIWAGSLADRHPRRRLVLLTQTNAIVQAILLAGLTLSGLVRPWHVLVLAGMLGLTYAFEIPARQALLGDIAGGDMSNAIALNSSIVNAARVVGPALAGTLVATVGEGWCFALNALSFLGTYRALLLMRPPPQPIHVGSRRAHLLEGLAYAGGTAHVRALLALLAVSSFFAMPYQTLLPVVSAEILRRRRARLRAPPRVRGGGRARRARSASSSARASWGSVAAWRSARPSSAAGSSRSRSPAASRSQRLRSPSWGSGSSRRWPAR